MLPMPDETADQLSQRLRASLSDDAPAVITEARRAIKSTRDASIRSVLAGVLVDAGVVAGDQTASKAGMAAIKGLLKKDPSNSGLQ
jgi:hypothetical protein